MKQFEIKKPITLQDLQIEIKQIRIQIEELKVFTQNMDSRIQKIENQEISLNNQTIEEFDNFVNSITVNEKQRWYKKNPCSEIKKSFDYFKTNNDSFFLSGNSYLLSFCSQFGNSWMSFTSHHFCHSHFPMHLVREFKIIWWAACKIYSFQTFESIKKSIDSKKSKRPLKIIPIWSQPLPWSQTPPKSSFPSNSIYKVYLKRLQKQAAETLSQLPDSDEDNDDTSSSSPHQQNEDMCFGIPYTLLESRDFNFNFQIPND